MIQDQPLRLSTHHRPQMLARMRQETFDLAIIGGGITGAGVARDAASRGMKVALVEARDFASGTSSRSSKLIHGGIRYLENFEFHLVFEALSERRILFQMAPHLVHPLRFVIPLFKGGRVGMFKMGLGMWAYDALSLFEAPELHERLNVDEAMERLPSLQTHDLLGAYAYSDAYMDDDRLVIETLRSAVSYGALCVNYVKAGKPKLQDGKITAIECESDEGRFELRAKHFVTSVGPWTDQFGAENFSDWKKVLRPTKGIHLTFSRERFPLKDAVVMAAESRIVFGIPRHEMVIVGTTDTDFTGPPESVRSEPEDVKYLLSVTDKYFPGARLRSSDILASYAGVRPLVDDGSSNEGKTSREHLIRTDQRNFTYVAGGKYTTYRKMAEEVVDASLTQFSMEDRIRFQRSATQGALNPLVTVDSLARARRRSAIDAADWGIPESIWRLGIERHGPEFIALVEDRCPQSLEQLWALEAGFAVREGMCRHLVDFYLRRSPLFLARADHGLSFQLAVMRAMADELGWTEAQMAQEREGLHQHLDIELAWRTKLS